LGRFVSQVVCWVKGDMLHMRPTASGLLDGSKKGSFVAKKGKETFPLTLWAVEHTDKDKFALTRPGGKQVKLRTDSQAEAEMWVKRLSESMRKAREEHAQQQQEHALKMAHKELKVLKGEEVGEEVSSREARLREAAERAAADKAAAKVMPPFGKFDPRPWDLGCSA
jgi:predicted component of type VI protein secretion system